MSPHATGAVKNLHVRAFSSRLPVFRSSLPDRYCCVAVFRQKGSSPHALRKCESGWPASRLLSVTGDGSRARGAASRRAHHAAGNGMKRPALLACRPSVAVLNDRRHNGRRRGPVQEGLDR